MRATPTARDLLDVIRHGYWQHDKHPEYPLLLASRVEATLAELQPGRWSDETADSLAARVLATLDGR
jgi:hypothetical protein